MNRRLIPVLIVLLPLWGAVLHAQTDELESYVARGRALSKAGKVDQALPYFMLSLEVAEARFGLDDPALIPLIDDLAGAHTARENYRDAEPLYERALRIQEQEAARHQTGIVRTLNKLGRIYEATDRAPEALALYRRVITLWAPVLGGDHPDVRIAGGRLAKLALRVPSESPPAASAPALAQAAPEPKKPEPKAVQAPPKPVPKPQVAEAKPPAPPQAVAPPAPERAPTPAVTDKMPASPPQDSEGFSVHLTSIRNPQDAQGEWDRLRRLYGGLLSDLELQVAKADLGPKRGIYYRIKGGLLTPEIARARCAAFAARGVWCDVTGPEGAGAQPMLAARGKTASAKPSPPAGIGLTPPAGIGLTPPASAGLTPASGYRVHLTSIRDPAAAEGEWRRLRRLYGKLLSDLTLTVVRADLGPGKGVYYRVQGGNLTRQDARALCAEFSALKIWCRVVRPGEEAAETSLRLALQRGRRQPSGRHRGTHRRHLGRHPVRYAQIRRRDRDLDPGCRRSPFTDPAI